MKKLLCGVSAMLVCAGMGVSSVAVAQDDEVLALGKSLFTEKATPACAVCHALEDAGAAGPIGPNLDELKPTKEVVLKVLHEGMGVMPSFATTLTEEEMEAVAQYVVSATGG